MEEIVIGQLLDLPDEQIERELAQLRVARADITVKIGALVAVLEVKARARGEGPPSRVPGYGARGSGRRPQPSTTREALLDLLGEQPPGTRWRARSIIGHLRERGWLEDRGSGAILQALARLVEAGKVERPTKGVYQLPVAGVPNKNEELVTSGR